MKQPIHLLLLILFPITLFAQKAGWNQFREITFQSRYTEAKTDWQVLYLLETADFPGIDLFGSDLRFATAYSNYVLFSSNNS